MAGRPRRPPRPVRRCGRRLFEQQRERDLAGDDPPILGADARVGQVRVDDVYVDAPRGAARGANAPLRLTLSNDGRRDDALVSVVTPAAERVGLLVDGRPRATIPLPAGTQRDGQYATDARLVSLREPLAPDSSIIVTFRFAQAGTVSLAVTVGG